MSTASWPAPVTLRGRHAIVEPLALTHHDDLADAVADGAEPGDELWRLWYTLIPSPQTMRAGIEKRLEMRAAGRMLPFAVLDAQTGKAIGMTSYMNLEPEHRRLEIGSTWTSRRVQRSGVNTECKLMLLAHAFESLACIAVEFRTHFFNQQSRRAIERLGAKLDGILRCHQVAPNGTLRDTCVYSIVAAEWPTVRTHLQWQLQRPRSATGGR